MAFLNSKQSRFIFRQHVDHEISDEGKILMYKLIQNRKSNGGLLVHLGEADLETKFKALGFRGEDHDTPDFFYVYNDFLTGPYTKWHTIPDWLDQFALSRLDENTIHTDKNLYAWRLKGSKHDTVVHWKGHRLHKGYDVDWKPFRGRRGKGKIKAVLGDMTEAKTRAIAITTDQNLTPVTAISKLIHELAGPRLARHCREIARFEIVKAASTPGYNLEDQRYSKKWANPSGDSRHAGWALDSDYLTLIHSKAFSFRSLEELSTAIEEMRLMLSAIFWEARENAVYSLAIPFDIFGEIHLEPFYLANLLILFISELQRGIDVEIWCLEEEILAAVHSVMRQT